MKARKEKARKAKIILIIFLVLAAGAFYIFFFYTKNCKTRDCFEIELAKCRKANFLKEQTNVSWFYSIKGSYGKNCVVYVKNIWLKAEGGEQIEGKDMICYLPKGVVAMPEADLELCRGILKEALQDLIIKKLHLYISQNIGEVKEELKKPL